MLLRTRAAGRSTGGITNLEDAEAMSTIDRHVTAHTRASAARPGYPVVADSTQQPLRGDRITGDRYWSRDFMEREWDRMWTRVWHVGGRLSEIPEPGDYVVHNF